MKTKRNFLLLLSVAVIGIAVYGGWALHRARTKLVTLDVRNMDVRKVVKKIEWQTWETILVQSNVQGAVTINVRKVPLDEVLAIVAEQTSARSGVVYPLYASRKSLASLEKVLRGEAKSAVGWTNVQSSVSSRVGLMGSGRNGFLASSETSTNQLVSLEIHDKDIGFTVLAFNRFAHARIIAEDGIWRPINLTLTKASVSGAIATLAKNVKRSWATRYTLRKEGGPGGSGPLASLDPNSARPPRNERKAPAAPTDEVQAQQQALEAELLQTLPLEERQRVSQAQVERKEQLEALQNMTPEQRRALNPPMGGRDMGKAMLDRIKNSTPEQRAQQRRQMAQMRPPTSNQFPRQ